MAVARARTRTAQASAAGRGTLEDRELSAPVATQLGVRGGAATRVRWRGGNAAALGGNDERARPPSPLLQAQALRVSRPPGRVVPGTL